MGLKTWKNAPHGRILKSDVTVAKNYLEEDEIKALERIVSMYLDYAENQASRQIPMRMADWVEKLDAFLQFNEYDVLTNAGKVSHEVAQKLAEEAVSGFPDNSRTVLLRATSRKQQKNSSARNCPQEEVNTRVQLILGESMIEPTITCPKCKTEIRLTESLAAPLIEATRQQFEEKLSQKDDEIAQREQVLRDKEKQVLEAKRTLEQQVADQVAEQLKAERQRVIEEESKKAKHASAAELESKAPELSELQEVLNSREAKLAEAQQAQAELITKQRELDDAKRELELTVAKRVQDGLSEVRTQAKREAEEGLKLKVAEKDQTIASMQQKIEELKQKAEQGSQQLQGEVLELELENLLRTKFPFDTIEPVPKGEFGGDTLQRVVSPSGLLSGTILWESKRTKNWSNGWLVKLREDQRTAKAEISVLVSQALPDGIETFDVIDGVWVTHPRAILPVATILRHTLLQVSNARLISEGQQTKAEMVYQYLTGPRFKQRVEAIVEAFSSMQDDLDRERKAIMKQWAKRQEQIERVMEATVGMYGDLQGIAGKSIQEIEGLSLLALPDAEKEN